MLGGFEDDEADESLAVETPLISSPRHLRSAPSSSRAALGKCSVRKSGMLNGLSNSTFASEQGSPIVLISRGVLGVDRFRAIDLGRQ